MIHLASHAGSSTGKRDEPAIIRVAGSLHFLVNTYVSCG